MTGYVKGGQTEGFNLTIGGEVPGKDGPNVHDGPGSKPSAAYGKTFQSANLEPTRPKGGSNVTSGPNSKSGDKDTGCVGDFPFKPGRETLGRV